MKTEIRQATFGFGAQLTGSLLSNSSRHLYESIFGKRGLLAKLLKYLRDHA